MCACDHSEASEIQQKSPKISKNIKFDNFLYAVALSICDIPRVLRGPGGRARVPRLLQGPSSACRAEAAMMHKQSLESYGIMRKREYHRKPENFYFCRTRPPQHTRSGRAANECLGACNVLQDRAGRCQNATTVYILRSQCIGTCKAVRMRLTQTRTGQVIWSFRIC